jgi:2-polyprenyl-3-methyl-5-hydroxy-6-metoxy-1,4-benzoquinol methylase
VRCDGCDFIYAVPRASREETSQLYASETYSSEAYLRRSLVQERIPDFERVYARLEEYLPKKGTLFEYGCAAGFFLEVGQRRGWNVCGADASPALVEYARDHFGLDVYVATSVRQVPLASNSVDVVYSEHVIEHLSDPLQALVQFRSILRPGGYLVITVPNELDEVRYFLRNTVFRAWAAKKSGGRKLEIGHINFFTLDTLADMVEQAGFAPVETSTWGVAARSPMVMRSSLFKRLIKKMLFGIAERFDKGPNIEVFAVKRG